MGFAHLLKTEAALATFRARFNVPLDVDIKYCHEGSIENDRRPHVVFFFSFNGYLKKGGGVDFHWIPYYLGHLGSMAFAPTNFHQISIEW